MFFKLCCQNRNLNKKKHFFNYLWDKNNIALCQTAAVLRFLYSLDAPENKQLKDVIDYYKTCFINNYQILYRYQFDSEQDYKRSIMYLSKGFVVHSSMQKWLRFEAVKILHTSSANLMINVSPEQKEQPSCMS